MIAGGFDIDGCYNKGEKTVTPFDNEEEFNQFLRNVCYNGRLLENCYLQAEREQDSAAEDDNQIRIRAEKFVEKFWKVRKKSSLSGAPKKLEFFKYAALIYFDYPNTCEVITWQGIKNRVEEKDWSPAAVVGKLFTSAKEFATEVGEKIEKLLEEMKKIEKKQEELTFLQGGTVFLILEVQDKL